MRHVSPAVPDVIVTCGEPLECRMVADVAVAGAVGAGVWVLVLWVLDAEGGDVRKES